MRVSVSLPEADLELLDEYVRAHGYASRSPVLHHAVTLLRAGSLTRADDEAFDEWEATEGASRWDRTAGNRGRS